MVNSSANEVISVSPAVLLFKLNRESESSEQSVILRITNISDTYIAYKIKTTQPSWYVVKPSQHVIDIGKYKDIEINIVEKESNRILDQANNNNIYEKLDKHRFLIQSTTISKDEYDKISVVTEQQRLSDITLLWEENKKEPYKLKLKVDFQYPDSNQKQQQQQQQQQAQVISKNAQIIEERLLIA